MFLKAYSKTKTLEGDQRLYYKLCESYRTADTVRHHIILNLGLLEQLPLIEDKKKLGIRISELVQQSRMGAINLFPPETDVIEQLAQKFFQEIKDNKRLDLSSERRVHAIDTESVENKDVVEIGAEWLCSQTLDKLGVASFLQSKNWSDEQIQLAYTHIISRAVYPASELKTSRWIKQNSGVCEITNYPIQKITKDKLYGISHCLYQVKDALEQHLSHKTNELFDITDTIYLLDLTNTYYEGAMRTSHIAKFGKSKEKRNDARLIVLALVINQYGFPKYSHLFEGNIADAKSLQEIIHMLISRTCELPHKPVIVMDAGVASESNLQHLAALGFDYICVSRKKYKDYTLDGQPHTITDNTQKIITLQKIKPKKITDNVIRVHSTGKALKENSMHQQFCERFEKGLDAIQQSLTKKSGIKQLGKVHQRIGRLKQKYKSTHQHYNIELIVNGTIATELKWQKINTHNNNGYYYIRTSLQNIDEHTQWIIYNTLREIESTFRCLKTDLDLRPIYHKTDAASMAHLHLGLLAYWVVNTIRLQLNANNIHTQWSEIVRVMNTQKLVTTTMKNEYEQIITIRQCSEPITEVEKIYQALHYKLRPFGRKKSVVTPSHIFENATRSRQDNPG
jgi:hypothetical protein